MPRLRDQLQWMQKKKWKIIYLATQSWYCGKNKTMMSHLLTATTRKTADTTTQTFCGRRQTSLDLLKFGLMLRLRGLPTNGDSTLHDERTRRKSKSKHRDSCKLFNCALVVPGTGDRKYWLEPVATFSTALWVMLLILDDGVTTHWKNDKVIHEHIHWTSLISVPVKMAWTSNDIDNSGRIG